MNFWKFWLVSSITVVSVLVAGNGLTASQTDSLHTLFDHVLRAHIKNGHVNYNGIKSDKRFVQYLNVLANNNPDTFSTKEEKLAFWINAYNAFAIKGIIDGRSPDSFFGRIGYFTLADYTVGGRTLDLYDLERDIIIPFNEPRIHFAIVCASQSCPALQSEAYLPDDLYQRLEVNAKAFINDPTKNRFDASRQKAEISMIFEWFEADFVRHAGSVQNYLARYLDDLALNQTPKIEIDYLEYDWTLNGVLSE